MSTKKTSNDYREERKARLAKASKQNHKKSHKISGPSISKGAKTVIYSVIAAVVVIAIAVGACYSFGVFERMKKIETVSGTSYSAVEYEYYYKSVYNYYYNMSAQYDSYYGSGSAITTPVTIAQSSLQSRTIPMPISRMKTVRMQLGSSSSKRWLLNQCSATSLLPIWLRMQALK